MISGLTALQVMRSLLTPAQLPPSNPGPLVSVPNVITTPGTTGTTSSRPARVWQQSYPTTIWRINHDLNRYPVVVLTDEQGEIVEAEIYNVDANNLSVYFNKPTTGTATLY